MTQGLFITGTDTGIGKTYVTLQLLKYYRSQNLQTAALKPIATECKLTAVGLISDDAVLLQNAATIKFPYVNVNPIAFEPPIAPHIAAFYNNKKLSVKNLLQLCQPVLQSHADIILVEGTGGWLVPLNDHETLADFALALNFPVILVVGIRLGCLNHALLTWENMQRKNTNVFGWIANMIEPSMLYAEENIQTLSKAISAPLLSITPYDSSLRLGSGTVPDANFTLLY